jgi:hypothetical protein
MKYILTLAVLLALVSCEKERKYRCECTGKRGVVLLRYDQDLTEAKWNNISTCEGVEDSFAAAAPGEEAQCFLYNTEDKI